MFRLLCLSIVTSGLVSISSIQAAEDVPNARRPTQESDLRSWLENMVWHHRYSDAQVRLATGMTIAEIQAAKSRLKITDESRPVSNNSTKLKVLPFPGGPHPRIGFLDGAIEPQRETKVSVFTPWQPKDENRADFVVVDVPEAIWSNLGLTYLAHTHVPTLWTKQNIELEKQEWETYKNGSYFLKRILPNDIAFTSKVIPKRDHVSMEMTLTNGTDSVLSDLRVQNCVMLKFADGFAQQTRENKISHGPFIAVHDESKERWIITAWTPNHRAWGNDKCPCLHSDPIFPECQPGETVSVSGFLSFYEGTDIQAEFERLQKSGLLDSEKE